MKKQLIWQEWIIFFLIVLIMLLIIGITHFNAYRAGKVFQLVQSQKISLEKTVTVTIEGCVVNPGSYTLEKGSRVNEVLIKAQPYDYADLTLLKTNKLLKNNEKILIHPKQRVSITIKGAVEDEQVIETYTDTALHEILDQIHLTEEADVAQLNLQKKIKNHTTLHIPKKKKAVTEEKNKISEKKEKIKKRLKKKQP